MRVFGHERRRVDQPLGLRDVVVDLQQRVHEYGAELPLTEGIHDLRAEVR